MIEIVRWSVSMTSTISSSDLLKFFASLVFTVFVDTIGGVLVDLTQSDLELTTVVQHCRNLVDCFPRVKLISLCWSPSLLQDLLTFAAFGVRLHLHCLLDRGQKDDILNLIPETFDVPSSGCFVDNPDNSLIESISLFEGSSPASCY